MKCVSCGKEPLSKNETGICKKLLGEHTTEFYCLDCLAEYLEVTLYANVPMTRPRLLIDGEFIDGELVADSRHAKFLLPKIKRRGEYFAEVYDGDVSRGVRLAFTAQKNTREVDLFGFGGKK